MLDVFSSVAQSCPTFCDPMDYNMPGIHVHHQLPEPAQTHVHWVSDAIQPSHPLSSPSPPAFNLSQHQGLFQWVSSLHQVAKVLELQHQSFQWIFRTGRQTKVKSKTEKQKLDSKVSTWVDEDIFSQDRECKRRTFEGIWIGLGYPKFKIPVAFPSEMGWRHPDSWWASIFSKATFGESECHSGRWWGQKKMGQRAGSLGIFVFRGWEEAEEWRRRSAKG